MPTRVALVSCAKQKRDRAAPARDLYLSQFFHGLRMYAEKHADAWYILSAEHGVLRPEQAVEPYERTLNTMPKTILSNDSTHLSRVSPRQTGSRRESGAHP